MAQTVVTCPNCETSFKVHVDATRGKCPSCDISLVFEDVSSAQQAPAPTEQPPEPRQPEAEWAAAPKKEEKPGHEAVEETVDIRRIEAAVDAIVDRTSAGKTTRAADIAAVESIQPDRDYSDIEKKVEKLVSTE